MNKLEVYINEKELRSAFEKFKDNKEEYTTIRCSKDKNDYLDLKAIVDFKNVGFSKLGEMKLAVINDRFK